MPTNPTHRDTFEQAFAEHYAAVLAYTLRRAPRSVAEEVASDTFLVAWRRIETMPADTLPWLLAVARRTLANRRRSDARADALVARLIEERPAAELIELDGTALEQGGTLEAALRALSDREREAVLLVAWEDLSPAQAAVVAGCTSMALRLRLHRGRRRLAAALGRSRDGRRLEPRHATGTDPNPHPGSTS